MSKIRIGKDITIQWLNIKTNGQATALSGRDLSLSLKMPNGSKMNLPFTIVNSNGIQATFKGIDHRCIGKHSLTLWENLGKVGENAIDKMRCFELVSTTEEEQYDGATEGFNTQTIALEGGVFVVGIKGDNGDAPTITSSKVGKVTKIYSNGVEIASINDGADGSISEADKAEIAGMVDISGKQDKLTPQQLANINADHSQYLTEHQDISGKVDKVDGMGLSHNDYTDADKDAVGNIAQLYRKPNDGIPLSDLAQSVQTSLGKADTALQSHQSLKTINNESILGEGNITIEGGGGGKKWVKIGCITLDNDTTQYAITTDEQYSELMLAGTRSYASTNKGYFKIILNDVNVNSFSFTYSFLLLNIRYVINKYVCKYVTNNNLHGVSNNQYVTLNSQLVADESVKDVKFNNIKLNFTTALVGDDVKKITLYAR